MINGIITGVLIILFVGIWIWAWSRKNKKQFDLMARLPLEEEADPSEENNRE
jgi:cytochrome c oxidase cbb3-type subunit 4